MSEQFSRLSAKKSAPAFFPMNFWDGTCRPRLRRHTFSPGSGKRRATSWLPAGRDPQSNSTGGKRRSDRKRKSTGALTSPVLFMFVHRPHAEISAGLSEAVSRRAESVYGSLLIHALDPKSGGPPTFIPPCMTPLPRRLVQNLPAGGSPGF